jgi:hypothetical protein
VWWLCSSNTACIVYRIAQNNGRVCIFGVWLCSCKGSVVRIVRTSLRVQSIANAIIQWVRWWLERYCYMQNAKCWDSSALRGVGGGHWLKLKDDDEPWCMSERSVYHILHNCTQQLKLCRHISHCGRGLLQFCYQFLELMAGNPCSSLINEYWDSLSLAWHY